MGAEPTPRKDVVQSLTMVLNGLYDGTYPTKTHALLDNRLYRQKLERWRDSTYKSDDEIVALIKEINEVGESCLFKSTLDQTVNSTAGIFGLKAIHAWQEKTEADKVEAMKSVLHFQPVKPADIEKRIADIEADIEAQE